MDPSAGLQEEEEEEEDVETIANVLPAAGIRNLRDVSITACFLLFVTVHL